MFLSTDKKIVCPPKKKRAVRLFCFGQTLKGFLLEKTTTVVLGTFDVVTDCNIM